MCWLQKLQDPLRASDKTLTSCGPYAMKEEDAMVYRRPYLTSGSSGFALTAISKAMKKELKVNLNLARLVSKLFYFSNLCFFFFFSFHNKKSNVYIDLNKVSIVLTCLVLCFWSTTPVFFIETFHPTSMENLNVNMWSYSCGWISDGPPKKCTIGCVGQKKHGWH